MERPPLKCHTSSYNNMDAFPQNSGEFNYFTNSSVAPLLALYIYAMYKHTKNIPCDWLNVSNLISFDRLVITHKLINTLSPDGLWDKFELRSVHLKYETRNCHDLQIPRLNTERAKNGFKYSALNYGIICLLTYERPQLSNASKRN